MKKTISLLLSLVMLLSITVGIDLSAYAEVSGDFEYELLDDGTAEITDYIGSATNLTIPSTIDGYTVTSIGDSAFWDCSSISSISIPSGVLRIGEKSFGSCTNLTNITIPNSVTSIGEDAFSECESLTSIEVGANNEVYSSDNGILYNKTKTELIKCPQGYTGSSYTIPEGVENIDNNAFECCTNLTGVSIPNSVTSIGSGAFRECTNLASIVISNNLTHLGGGAFFDTAYYNDESNWQNDTLYIGNALISAKDTLTGNYKVKDGTVAISESAFWGCTNLASVTLPYGLRIIDNYVFNYCSNLKSVTIPNSVKSIGNQAFGSCTNLTNITIPNSVTKIGWNAFGSCKSLTNVVIPSSVTSIDSEIFGACEKLKSVTIPKSIKEIGAAVFYNTSLTDIYYNGSISDWNSIKITEAGNENLKKATIHCSNGVINCQHKSTKTTTTKATTSKDGKIVKVCTVCGKTVSTTVIPKASSIKLSATSYTYNGKVKTPAVTVKDSKGKTLKKNTDYTVSYASGRKYVGKYAVKITFKGNYSGTKTLNFYIKPKATSISSVSAGSKKFTVKWKKQATQTTGYQIQYSTSSKFSKAKTVTVGKNSTTSKAIKKLKGKKKYYVRVRTYKTVKINGKATKIYSSWSKAKSVTTKK